MNEINGNVAAFIFLVLFSSQNLGAQERKPGAPAADSTYSAGEVTISAYRLTGDVLTTPGSISVLTGDVLPGPGGLSLSTAINSLPGMNMQTGTLTTSRIVIRGMGSRTPYNSNRIRAYLNDIPLTTADGISTPEEIDPRSIGKIEIIKGPASALYGSGLGGSINMFTPQDSSNNVTAEAQYGSFNTLKANLSGSFLKNKTSLWANINQLSSDGFRENNNFRRTAIISTAGWKHKSWSVNSTVMLLNIKGGIPSSLGYTQFRDSPAEAAPNWKAIGGFKEYTKAIAGISVRNNITSSLSGSYIFFAKLNNSYEKRPFNNLDDHTISEGLRYLLNYRKGMTEMVAGIEISGEQYKWKLDLNGSLLNENKETRHLINTFGMINFKPLRTLILSAGGAFNYVTYRLKDMYPSDGDQSGSHRFPVIFSPRLGINYSPDHQIAFFASAGQGFSLPSTEETLLPEGIVNPGIKPEQGMQYEAGTRFYSADNKTELDVSVYWIELKNLLVTKRITEDIFTGINAGRTRHFGLELLLRQKIFAKNFFPGTLSSVLSFTGSNNRFIDFTDNDISYDGKYLPGIPGYTARLQFNWNAIESLELITDMQYTGSQFLNDSNSTDYPGYFLMNTTLNTKFRVKQQTVGAWFGINNLTGTRYASMLIINALGFNNSEPRYYYPGMPRHFSGGIRVTFN